MSCRLTALFISFLLLLLRVQSIDLTRTRSLPSPSDFDLPEVDGSAVDDICRIFSVQTPGPITTTTITTTTTTTTSPITRKQVVATTKKPAVQSPPRKPETKNNGTPIRKLPAPGGPITNSFNNPAASLLYHLLFNSRRHAAGSLPGLNSFISQPIGGLPLGGDSTTSHSNELVATLLKGAGRTRQNRWKIGLFSSEDSSDES